MSSFDNYTDISYTCIFFFQYKVLPIFGQVIGYISGKNRLIMTKQHSSYTGLVGIMILKIEQCTYYAEYVHVTYYTWHAIHINMNKDKEYAAKQRFNKYTERCRTQSINFSSHIFWCKCHLKSLHNQNVSFYCKTDIKVMSWSNIHIITWCYAILLNLLITTLS